MGMMYLVLYFQDVASGASGYDFEINIGATLQSCQMDGGDYLVCHVARAGCFSLVFFFGLILARRSCCLG